MNRNDSIEEELQECFIAISETNTEDEITKSKNHNKSITESDISGRGDNLQRNATISSDSSINDIEINKFKKGKTFDNNFNGMQAAKLITKRVLKLPNDIQLESVKQTESKLLLENISYTFVSGICLMEAIKIK